MTTRRSFLKLLAAALSSLLPLHLIPKGKTVEKRFEGRLGWIRMTEGTRYKTQEDWDHVALDFNNAERKVHIFIDDLYLGIHPVSKPDNGDLIDFSESTVELTLDPSFQDLEGSFTMTIPLDRRYWKDGTPIES